MKVRVKLVQKDLLENKESVIVDTIGLLNSDRLLYKEAETGAKHRVSFSSEGVVLERSAEVSSRSDLKLRQKGESVVSSPYGEMRFETYCRSLEKREDRWQVEYSILQQGEVVSDFILIWYLQMIS